MAGPRAEPSEAISVEDDNDSSATRERQIISILDKLRAPGLSRKRKLAPNTAVGNRRANAKVSNPQCPQYELKISSKERFNRRF